MSDQQSSNNNHHSASAVITTNSGGGSAANDGNNSASNNLRSAAECSTATAQLSQLQPGAGITFTNPVPPSCIFSAPGTGSSSSSFTTGETPTAIGEQQKQQMLLRRTIPCETRDGEVLEVEVGLLLQSNTFKHMWKDLGLASSEEVLANEFTFPVKAISGPILRKVVEWCREHVGCPEPVIQEDPVSRERKWFLLTDWQRRFFDVPVDELAELLVAGNFLDIKSLYLYGCQSMAAVIKDKSPEQIREMFGFEDDLTEEEKAEIRKKNIWCSY